MRLFVKQLYNHVDAHKARSCYGKRGSTNKSVKNWFVGITSEN